MMHTQEGANRARNRPARSASSQTLAAVLGPTNTGKTHYAIERMLGHDSGMIGAPLRLLAREIYDRVVAARGKRSVALITGEEKIIPDKPSYWICTVEAMPLERRVSFMAIDEIQLAQDPDRGHTFTHRLLHARGTQETLFLGAATMKGVIKELIPDVQFIPRTRMSQLSYSGPKKVSRLPRRSAVVAFSADQVYGLAELLRRQRGGAAVVMGALSPRTRNAQVALYQSGEVDFIVATDAIGMGLNMDVDHVAFAARRKFDGSGMRELRANELAQIAGRAGRYLNDGTFGVTGETTPFEAELVEQIETHRFDPVKVLQWRNADLDFSSVDKLIESLDAPPTRRGLRRSRPAIDQIALKQLSLNRLVTDTLNGPRSIKELWSVCQIPDFQQTMIDNHVRLLTNVYLHLAEGDGHLPDDWIGAQVERLAAIDGDIDALSARIAHIRTWTFISNRTHWLARPSHWQDRTREIEDKLSDALHDKLTQAFIDRRTTVLMKRLHQSDKLLAAVDKQGEVTVEGEYLGRLSGFQFVLDPRAGETKSALETKALRGAASRALRPYVRGVMERLIESPDEAFSLQESGVLLWEGQPVGRINAGSNPLHPTADITVNDTIGDLIGGDGRDAVKARLQSWVNAHIAATLAPLLTLEEAVNETTSLSEDAPVPLGAEQKSTLEGLARGIGYRLFEALGALPRTEIAADIKELGPPERAQLRALGVRFGEFTIHMPALLKPAQARLLILLWGIHSGAQFSEKGIPSPPQAGLTSAPINPDWTDAFLTAAGYRRCRSRVVRIDILERIGNLIRKQRFPEAEKAKEKPEANGALSSAETTADGENETNAPEVPLEVNQSVVESGQSEEAPSPESNEAPAADPNTDQPTAESVSSESAVPETTGEQAASETPQQDPKPQIPPGSFLATAEMLSLAGCSMEDFYEILRSLGYRGTPLKRDEPEQKEAIAEAPAAPAESPEGEEGAAPVAKPDPKPEVLLWRPARPRNQRSGPGRGHSGGPPNGKRKAKPGGKPGQNRHGQNDRNNKSGGKKPNRPPPKKEKPMDPDSPFAVLAQLKDNMSR